MCSTSAAGTRTVSGITAPWSVLSPGMAAAEVVGHTPADRIELDPAADAVAVGRRLRLLEGQHLGLEKLQLQRDQQPVLRATGRSRTKHSPATNISRATMACRP
jgi:hypothetical protein